MIDRWELFQKLLMVAIEKSPVDWKQSIGWFEDAQDTNVKYMVIRGEDQTVAQKVTDYVMWKLGQGPKPFWFIKAQ